MRVAIAGYNGFIGSSLRKGKSDIEFVLLDRPLLYGPQDFLVQMISGCDVVMNFAGKSIFTLWTKRKRKAIWDSRILVNKKIVEAINACSLKPRLFISGSAVGIYSDNVIHTETSTNYAADFLADLVQAWEAEIQKLDASVNYAIIRTGLVLGKDGGLFPLVRRLSSYLPALIPGSGRQAFPFIHISDFVRGIYWIIDKNKGGIYNFVAPAQVDYRSFIFSLAATLNNPVKIRIPALFFRVLLGKSSVLLLKGQAALPENLLKSGFRFDFIDLHLAIEDLIKVKG